MRILIDMPNSMLWCCRVFGYLAVSLSTLHQAQRDHDPRLLAFQSAAFGLMGVAGLFWAFLDRREQSATQVPKGRAFPVLLALITLLAAAICATRDGAFAVILAAMVASVAAADCALTTALAVTGLGILSVLTCLVVVGGTGSTAALLGLPAAIASGMMLGLHRRTYRGQAEQAALLLSQSEQLRAQAEELRIQQRRADVLDERARIAREIHDVLAHSLGGLGIQIQAAQAVLIDSADVGKAVEVLGLARKLASDGLTETRRALHALRTDTLSLDEELRNLAARHEQMYHAQLALEITGASRELPPAAGMALLRVAQESAVNAAKHAPGRDISVCLEYRGDGVRLTVANPLTADGAAPGLPELQTADAGYGLAGMRERLALIGGKLEVGRREGTWTVDAEVPLAPQP